MKCSDCNGRGSFQFAFSNPKCDQCNGTGQLQPAVVEKVEVKEQFNTVNYIAGLHLHRKIFESYKLENVARYTGRAVTVPVKVTIT